VGENITLKVGEKRYTQTEWSEKKGRSKDGKTKKTGILRWMIHLSSSRGRRKG
jgi:hypothetical protein